MSEYACIIIDETINSYMPVIIKASSRDEARKKCHETSKAKIIAVIAVVEVKDGEQTLQG